MMREIKNKTFMRKLQRGYSLVELMVSIGIVLVVAAAIFIFSISAQKRLRLMQARTEAIRNCRLAVENLKRDIISAAGLDDGTNTSVVLNAYPLNADGTPDTSSVNYDKITYNLQGGVLTRSIDCSAASYRTSASSPGTDVDGEVIAKDITSNVLFSYEDESLGDYLQGSGSASDVKYLDLTVEVTSSQSLFAEEGKRRLTYKTRAYIRNKN